ncbi:BTAD domain-containing putative transcriptional regulator [Nocardia sp. NPDC127526]|uniref:AfsR/SARP family transcriptional regulator n=1 Tax=Nocardia sp. NPDC127526 TaxID=3345393 RepID=UPI0036425828
MSWQLAVLGPVEFGSAGVPTAPMPPKQQAALVMLVCARGRAVSVEELIDGIWGADRPTSAVGALRNYAWALRKTLAASAVQLFSESRGYRLEGPVDLDIDRIDAVRSDADRARAAGNLEQADTLVRSALRLWRGDPLSGVPGPWAAAERARLRRLHRVLEEDLIEIAVQRGEYSRAIADLAALITGDPHSERLRALMMTALYRAGRRTEALDEFQRIRRLLVTEQGIEPGPVLLELHRQILADELPAAAPAPAAAPRPAQLPPDTADFTGRHALVRELCTVLGGPAAPPIVAISGMGGVGKTALAVHVAHRIRDRYPDGQLYVDLCGAGSEPADPEHVLGAFLRALGVPQRDVPVGVAERGALFRTAISGRRMMLLLDNAADAAQLAALLPGDSGCAVLVTARRPLTALPGVHATALTVLESAEAVELFARIAGARRVMGDIDAAQRIVELCGLLPMAVRIVAARVAARPRWTLVSEADRLAAERHDLDRFRVGDLALTAAFRAGYEQLPEDTARAFRLLAVADLPDLPLAATAAVLDTIEPLAEDLCEELVDRGMLETIGRGRYHYHDLMRLFAIGRQAAEVDVTARLLDYYLATVKTVLRVRHPGLRLRLAPTANPGTRLADLDATLDFLTVERRNLVALYRMAVAGTARHRALAADLALAVGQTMLAGDATVDLEKALEELIRAIEGDGNAVAARRARLALVFALVVEFSAPERAAAHLQRLLAEADPEHEPWVAGTTNVFAGILALYDQDPHRGATHFATALRLFRSGVSPEGVRIAYSFLAQAHSAAGRNRDALAAAARAVVGDSHAGTRLNAMWALTEAACVLSSEGEDDLGARLFDAALHAARRAGSTRFESAVHARAAQNHLAAGRLREAAHHAERAEQTRAGHLGLVGTHNLLVRYTALRRLGRNVDAAECYRAATTQIPDFHTTLTRWSALLTPTPTPDRNLPLAAAH